MYAKNETYDGMELIHWESFLLLLLLHPSSSSVAAPSIY